MKQGKLTNKQLKSLILDKLSFQRSEVLVGSNVGEDCAVIDFGADLVVASTDPITGADKNAGKLAIVVNANDICAAGATPVCALITLMVPPDTLPAQIETIIDQTIAHAEKFGIQIAGGHTEVTDAVTKPIICTTMLGKTKKKLSVKNILPGDTLIMTKYAGIEGTYIIASDFHKNIELTADEYGEALAFEHELSIALEAKLIASLGNVNSMHDVTEGGILGAVYEMCEGSDLGIHVEIDSIAVHEVTKKICDALDLNPYRLISSGSLLAAVDSDGLKELELLQSHGIKCSIIGKFNDTGKVTATKDGKSGKVNPPSSDELYKVIGQTPSSNPKKGKETDK